MKPRHASYGTDIPVHKVSTSRPGINDLMPSAVANFGHAAGLIGSRRLIMGSIDESRGVLALLSADTHGCTSHRRMLKCGLPQFTAAFCGGRVVILDADMISVGSHKRGSPWVF